MSEQEIIKGLRLENENLKKALAESKINPVLDNMKNNLPDLEKLKQTLQNLQKPKRWEYCYAENMNDMNEKGKEGWKFHSVNIMEREITE